MERLTSLDDSIAEAPMGTIWSSSPVDLLEIFSEVGLGKCLDTKIGGGKTGHHPLEPERVAQALRNLGVRSVGPIEGRGEILEKLRTVGEDTGADLIERVIFFDKARGLAASDKRILSCFTSSRCYSTMITSRRLSAGRRYRRRRQRAGSPVRQP